MLKDIGGNQVEVSEQEYEYYKFLTTQYTLDDFNGLFSTDGNGMITRIAPIKPTPWVIMFFIQNIMINQHLDSMDERIDTLEKRLEKLNG